MKVILLLGLIVFSANQVAMSGTVTLLTKNEKSRSLLYQCSGGAITEELRCVKRGSLVKKWICGEKEYQYIDRFLDIATDASCSKLIASKIRASKKDVKENQLSSDE